MKRRLGRTLVTALAVLGGTAPVVRSVPPADAMCMPFCRDCDLRSRGQITWVILEPDGHVGLIPNVRLEGPAADFGLVVPTPSVPDLVPVPVDIWDESFNLTAAAAARGDERGSGFGCGHESFVVTEPARTEDVTILVQKTVGDFDVTVLAASDSQALVDWLDQNGFDYTPDDVARFTPYVEAGWVFTAMHLAEGVPVPSSWNINLDPVLFTFEASEVRIPLPLLSIHRSDTFPMAFFVLADHRMDLPGFTTEYANRLSPGEFQAIRDRYPTLGSFLTEGRFVTRLYRLFGIDDPMDQDLLLVRAPSDAEYRRVSRSVVFGSFPAGAGTLVAALGLAWLLDRRRRKQPGPDRSAPPVPPT